VTDTPTDPPDPPADDPEFEANHPPETIAILLDETTRTIERRFESIESLPSV
jgi:hypothetical protein